MIIENIKDFDLAQTLDCGQAFRWRELEDGSFKGVAFGRLVTFQKDDEKIIISGCGETDFEKIWRNYLDLDLDYSSIKSDLSKLHPTLADAARFAPGIRILNQEPWEALCSFIISQNNNIPRIKGIVERLCQSFGDPIEGDFCTFPSAERIAALSPEDLSPIRAGFRARYIIDGARKVANGEIDLEKVRFMEIEDARKELMKITGVGIKVADCTLLYGLHRLDCFPLDVWMKRAMATLFPEMNPSDFGKYGGIAQQYIFHYSRMHPELFQPATAGNARRKFAHRLLE